MPFQLENDFHCAENTTTRPLTRIAVTLCLYCDVVVCIQGTMTDSRVSVVVQQTGLSESGATELLRGQFIPFTSLQCKLDTVGWVTGRASGL